MPDETASPSRIKIPWLLGTLAAFALFAVIASYSSRMTWDTTDYDQDRAQQRLATLDTVQKAENALLCPVDPKDPEHHPTAEWVDQAKGTIRIPIDEAMVKEIDTLKAQPAAIGAEIPAAAPPAPAKAAPAKPSAPAAKTAAPTLPAANLNESKP